MDKRQLVLVKLGNVDKGYIPPKTQFDKFEAALKDTLKGEEGIVLVTDAFVSVTTLDLPANAKLVMMAPNEQAMVVVQKSWWKRLLGL